MSHSALVTLAVASAMTPFSGPILPDNLHYQYNDSWLHYIDCLHSPSKLRIRCEESPCFTHICEEALGAFADQLLCDLLYCLYMAFSIPLNPSLSHAG